MSKSKQLIINISMYKVTENLLFCMNGDRTEGFMKLKTKVKIISNLKKVWHCYEIVNMRKISKRAEKLLPYYQDDISVKWLRAREKYYQTRDLTIFSKVEKSYGKNREYYIEEVEADRIVLVYGDKNDLSARYAKQVIKMSNFGKKCRFVSEEEYRNSCENLISDNAVIIPAMPKENILGFLSVARDKGDWDRLLIPRHEMLLGTVGWQYFDMFPSDRDEVVVDAGVFDGKTESEIFRWGGGKHKENICI